MEASKPSSLTTAAAAETPERESVEPQASSARRVANTVKEYVAYALGYLLTKPATTDTSTEKEQEQAKPETEAVVVAKGTTDRRRFSSEQQAELLAAAKKRKPTTPQITQQEAQPTRRSFGRRRITKEEDRLGVIQVARRRLTSNGSAKKLDRRAARMETR